MLWYPCEWKEVSEDELVFLIPSLAARDGRDANAHPHGSSHFLIRALHARLRWAALALARFERDHAASTPSEIAATIARAGALVSPRPENAWTECERPFRELYAIAPEDRSNGWLHDGRNPEAKREAWIRELAILKCLNRLLQDSLRRTEIIQRTDPLEFPFCFADVLVASTYASFNAAYVYPQFSAFHELFAAGAWLGNLLRGRAALMPVFVAEIMLDLMRCQPVHEDSESAQCGRFLAHHIDAAVGLRKLLKIARRTRGSGRPAIVRPARRAREDAGRAQQAWNGALFREIAASLTLDAPFEKRVPCYSA
jgi:hypothetical protein